MDRELIERPIESAKARIYKLFLDKEKNPSAGHQKKIERQTEVMEVTVEALEKYAEYKAAEEQGLLLRLPCKVGDVVYCIDEEWEDIYDNDTRYLYVAEDRFYLDMLDNIGKSVFLTQAEAEAALEKMKGEEHER